MQRIANVVLGECRSGSTRVVGLRSCHFGKRQAPDDEEFAAATLDTLS
jgi:hypothetical protein